MKHLMICTMIFVLGFGVAYSQGEENMMSVVKADSVKSLPVVGTWIRIGPAGPMSLTFRNTGWVEGDFGNDGSVDVVDSFEIRHDTVGFIDKEGQMCEGMGQYKMRQTTYYLSFDLMDDLCGGRIQTLMGFWVRPDYQTHLEELEKKIDRTPKPELYLNRARIYMALGQPKRARADFDVYLESDSTNARVYLNRAGTRFPDDLEGAVVDCNKSIVLDPGNKNAWFLRGLARYTLGEKEQACGDFTRAIELGFSVLRMTEQQRCLEYWKEEE